MVASWKPNKENYSRRKKPSAVSKTVNRSNRNKDQKLTFRFNTIEVTGDRRGSFRAVGTKR